MSKRSLKSKKEKIAIDACGRTAVPCCLIKTNSREKFPRIASGLLFWKSSQVMKESRNCCINLQYKSIYKYRTRAIITRGLYIYYPMFEGQFFVFKGVFSENSVLMYGYYLRAVYNQERVMMARTVYVLSNSQRHVRDRGCLSDYKHDDAILLTNLFTFCTMMHIGVKSFLKEHFLVFSQRWQKCQGGFR